jgi:hypothetical protein
MGHQLYEKESVLNKIWDTCSAGRGATISLGKVWLLVYIAPAPIHALVIAYSAYYRGKEIRPGLIAGVLNDSEACRAVHVLKRRGCGFRKAAAAWAYRYQRLQG